MRQKTTGTTLGFHWSYIILPLLVLILSIILSAVFYSRLPAQVAYHFQSDGSPDKWLSRVAVILWMLLPQLIFTLAAGAIILGVVRLSARFRQAEGTRVKPGTILFIMGNMIVLPQVIIGFAMLDIFVYNSYQIHLLPLWVFALIVIGFGGIMLSLFFIQAIMRAWGTNR